MKSVVLDTSAIIRLYIPDGELPAGLAELLEQAVGGDVALMVPDLALAEIAQVLRKKERASFLTAAESDEILDAVLALPLDVIGHRELLPAALALARSRNLTVYDALFLALAEQRNAKLVTADERLKRAAGPMTAQEAPGSSDEDT